MMNDETLIRRIEAARVRTLQWLDSMQLANGASRISPAHDPERWPGMLLPGTYNAVMCRDLLDAPVQNADLAAWLLSHRRADGVFRVPGMTDDTVFKRPERSKPQA